MKSIFFKMAVALGAFLGVNDYAPFLRAEEISYRQRHKSRKTPHNKGSGVARARREAKKRANIRARAAK